MTNLFSPEDASSIMDHPALPHLVRAGAREAVASVSGPLVGRDVDWSSIEIDRAHYTVEKRLAVEIVTAARSRPGVVKHVGAIWCDTPAEGSRVLAAHAGMFAEPDRLAAAVEGAFLDAGKRRELFERSDGQVDVIGTHVVALSSHACEACSGHGSVGCRRCGETGRVHCHHCQAGQVSCGGCSGRGRVQRANNWDRNGGAIIVWDNCSMCFGSGSKRCPSCFGSMRLSCNPCGGTGALRCDPCLGHGTFSDWFELSVGATFETRCDHGLPALVAEPFEAWTRGGFPDLAQDGRGPSLDVDRPSRDEAGSLHVRVSISGHLDTCRALGRFGEARVQAAGVELGTPAVAYNAFLEDAVGRMAAACLEGAETPSQVALRVSASPLLAAVVEHLAASAKEDPEKLVALTRGCNGAVRATGLADFCRDYRAIKRRFCQTVWRGTWMAFLRRIAPLPVVLLAVDLLGLMPRLGSTALSDAMLQALVLLLCASIPAAFAMISVRRETQREMGQGAAMASGMSPALFPAASVVVAVGCFALSLLIRPPQGAPISIAPQLTPVKTTVVPPREPSVPISRPRGNGFVPL